MQRFTLLLILSIILFGTSCKKGHLPNSSVVKLSKIDSSFLTNFQQTNGITAAKGTRSMTLSDGSILWLFGEGHLNDFVAATGLISCTSTMHNGAMLMNTNNQMQTLNAANSDFIPSNELGTWFTPLHAYQYFDTIFVFAKKEGNGNHSRTYVAKIQFPSMQFIRIDSLSFNNMNFGYSIIPDTALGYCYIYGLRQPNATSTNSVYVARFSLTSPHATWEFYVNGDWFNLASSASVIATIPAENFSIRKVTGRYILLSQQAGGTCNTGTEIYSDISSFAWGSFTNHHVVYSILDRYSGFSPSTDGICIQPQFTSNGELLATYSVYGYAPCVSTCISGFVNPDYFRVKTLRIPLSTIDPNW